MKKSEERKSQLLLKFYAEYGFDHTVEETAKALHVTPKTLFNRYETKEKMELSAMRYWQSYTRMVLEEKCAFANNCVESLLLIICEIIQLRDVTRPLFDRKVKDLLEENKLGNEELSKLLIIILENGATREHSILSDQNFLAYIPYLLLNVFIYVSKDQMNQDIVAYLFHPILTEMGREMLDAIDVESLIFKQSNFPVLR